MRGCGGDVELALNCRAIDTMAFEQARSHGRAGQGWHLVFAEDHLFPMLNLPEQVGFWRHQRTASVSP